MIALLLTLKDHLSRKRVYELTPDMIVTPGERVIERRTRARLSSTAHSRAAVKRMRADPLRRVA